MPLFRPWWWSLPLLLSCLTLLWSYQLPLILLTLLYCSKATFISKSDAMLMLRFLLNVAVVFPRVVFVKGTVQAVEAMDDDHWGWVDIIFLHFILLGQDLYHMFSVGTKWCKLWQRYNYALSELLTIAKEPTDLFYRAWGLCSMVQLLGSNCRNQMQLVFSS